MRRSQTGRLPSESRCARRGPVHLGWAGACYRTVCSRDRNRGDRGSAGSSGIWVAVVLWLLVTCLQFVHGDVFAGVGDRSIRHRLLEGSVLVDDCPPCARPIIPLRLRGTFDVTAAELGSGVQRLGLHNIAWRASAADGTTIGISGTGHVTMRPGGAKTWCWTSFSPWRAPTFPDGSPTGPPPCHGRYPTWRRTWSPGKGRPSRSSSYRCDLPRCETCGL